MDELDAQQVIDAFGASLGDPNLRVQARYLSRKLSASYAANCVGSTTLGPQAA